MRVAFERSTKSVRQPTSHISEILTRATLNVISFGPLLNTHHQDVFSRKTLSSL